MFLGYGEKAGSGADTIVKGWQDNKWGRPVIQEKVQPDTVTLILTIDHSVNNPQNVPRQSQDVPSSSQDVPRQNLVRLKLSQACPKLAQRYIGKATIALTAMLEHDKSLTKLMEIVGEKNRSRLRQQILIPLIDAELAKPTIKDIPNSPKQTYILTEAGKALLRE